MRISTGKTQRLPFPTASLCKLMHLALYWGRYYPRSSYGTHRPTYTFPNKIQNVSLLLVLTEPLPPFVHSTTLSLNVHNVDDTYLSPCSRLGTPSHDLSANVIIELYWVMFENLIFFYYIFFHFWPGFPENPSKPPSNGTVFKRIS